MSLTESQLQERNRQKELVGKTNEIMNILKGLTVKEFCEVIRILQNQV